MSSTNARPLAGKRVFLSAAVPDDMRGSPAAAGFFDFLSITIHGILSAGGILVFGGHPTVTPLVHRVAQLARAHRQIELYQLAFFRGKAPPEVDDESVFLPVEWIGRPEDEPTPPSLGVMRDRMTSVANAAVFVGGRTIGFLGREPGIVDEYWRFIGHHPAGPAYLVGLLRGATALLIEEHERAGSRPPSGLDEQEVRALHTTRDVDLAGALVLAGLQRDLRRRVRGRGRSKTRRGR